MEERGFVVACKSFFEMKPGQTLLDFKKEVAELTPKDRQDLIPGLEAALGCKIKAQ